MDKFNLFCGNLIKEKEESSVSGLIYFLFALQKKRKIKEERP